MRRYLVLTAILVVAVGVGGIAVASGSHDHSSHDPRLCHELKITLGGDTSGPGAPLLTPNKFPIKVVFLSRGYGIKVGNSVKVFVDFALAHQNTNVTADEYDWELDLASLADGMHYVLVNACDHNDHLGVASVMINVRSMAVLGKTVKAAIVIPPGQLRGLARPVPVPTQGQVAPPAFDTDLQARAISCCGHFGDWPVAADCSVMVPVPAAAYDGDPIAF